ncbi:MAG: hypothetical protein ABI723_21675 [Bacteroidia bacterium]
MNQEQKIEVAKTFYLSTDKTQKEICEIVEWTEKTFREQKQKGKWNEMRETKNFTKQQIITMMHHQTFKLMQTAKDENRMLSASEIDSVAKLTAAIDKLEKRATLETYIEVFEEYNKFLLPLNGAFAQANNGYQDLFIQSKLKR